MGRKAIPMDDTAREIFEKIVKESNSFDDFVQNFGKFLGVSWRYRIFFISLINTASTLNDEQISMLLAGGLHEFGKFNYSRMITFSKYVKNAFKNAGSQVRLVTFVKEVVRYKDYEFSNAGVRESSEESTHE